MSRTIRAVATLVVVGIITTVAPLVRAVPASAARPKTIAIADAAIVEGDAGTKSLAFNVTWTGAKGGGAVSVAYATADGTATAGSDYTAKSGTVSLPSGCKCGTISIPIVGDAVTEGTETFTVNLSLAVNATIGDSQAVGTIFDNEGPAAFVILDGSANENAGPVAFSVIMTNSSGTTQTVDYATSDGSATAGADYTATSGTLTFTAGQTSKTVNVPVLNDTLNEADEMFTLTLSNTTLALNDATAAGTITDDDAEPTVSIGDAGAPEGDGTVSFTVSLSALSGQEVDVDYATTDGTALAGSDYVAATGTAVIPAGSASTTIDVTVTDDTTYENDEGFTIEISSPFNASIVDAQGAGTIANDDALPSASIGDVSVAEGTAGSTPAGFTVTLSNPSAFTATVDWATADGSATEGSDYTGAGGTLTFDPGVTSQPVSVDVLGDTMFESDETFTVTLSNPTGSTIGSGTGTGTITNDDKAVTTLTLAITKTKAKVGAKGVLERATADASVTVTIYRRHHRHWVKLSTKTVGVRSLGDRDADATPDATYRAGFPRPTHGTYRFVATFAGNASLLPSSSKT
ncbi:MAG TPA: Calx-beta domain-containing protein, partial [Acidimicrobiia bacterium]|nr:Calx-beta domain-containing protein [Acidimicrobiia bacterium]